LIGGRTSAIMTIGAESPGPPRQAGSAKRDTPRGSAARPERCPMDHAHNGHPTLAQLQAFDTGQLPAAEQAPVECHLQRCPECGEALDALPEAPLVALLRAFAGRHEDPGPAAAEGGNAPTPLDFPTALIGHRRYRVLEVLGAGGMGVVYKAVHRLMDRVVALKVIHRHLTDRPGLVERFRREVRAAARLTHPNIVTAYDADQAGDTHFLVMEHVAGISLDREVVRRGPLPVREACDLARQAALGLQHAYERGLVHRDLKPHNLLLTPAGQVKILDFGLAHVADADNSAATPLSSGMVLGTPDYVAPEQARDPAQADIRADVYSLGCTLYHLLTGRPPFPDGTPLQKLLAHQECRPRALTAARADVPEALAAIVERMLSKDPARRYPTPADVVADLARFLDPVPAPSAPARRRPSWRVLTLAAGALAALGTLSLAGYLARFAVPSSTRSDDRGASLPANLPVPRGAREPAAVASAEELAWHKRERRDRAVGWLRANNRSGPGHPVVAYMASRIDQDLDVSEAFQVVLGPGLVKSAKPTLLVGRAGAFDVFELRPELARDFSIGEQGCRVRNYSTADDLRRAAARVLLSDLVIDSADGLFPERPLTGSVAYRILGRWPGECALRLTYYFGTRGRTVLIPRDRLPEADQGTLPFSFPPLGKPQEVMPGPDVVFVEFITQDSGRTIVESNAAAVVVRVVPPEGGRP
jgi:serine/threonine protein kinase